MLQPRDDPPPVAAGRGHEGSIHVAEQAAGYALPSGRSSHGRVGGTRGGGSGSGAMAARRGRAERRKIPRISRRVGVLGREFGLVVLQPLIMFSSPPIHLNTARKNGRFLFILGWGRERAREETWVRDFVSIRLQLQARLG